MIVGYCIWIYRFIKDMNIACILFPGAPPNGKAPNNRCFRGTVPQVGLADDGDPKGFVVGGLTFGGALLFRCPQ